MSNNGLKKLVQQKFNQVGQELKGLMHFQSMELEERVNENGETTYVIEIMDKTVSFTTIICDEEGWRAQWGSSTPDYMKSLIEKAMSK